MNVWDKLHGSRVVQGLADQMASGEIAHAWLLLGPSGSGKTSAALAMAASLNCPVEPGIGCGTCSTCARIIRRRHPDVHHVVAEGAIIPVDLIREVVIPEAARSPFEGRYKVFIIEDADRMNPPAQNALLKTLEEPQPDTVFILLSGNEDEVLETIRSRCRTVRLEPVPEARIIEILEEDGASEETSLLAARLSDGDFERARTLAEDPVALERRRLWLGVPERLLSPVDAQDAAAEILAEAKVAVKEREKSQKDELAELADTLGQGRGTAGARTALTKRHKRELRRLEEDVLGEALSSIASFYKDVIVVRSGGAEAVTNIDLLPTLESWAATDTPTGAFLRAAERCIDVRASFISNANASLAIEAALLEVSTLVTVPSAAGVS
jgi:DNA polymerase-3 subunit delta'